MAEACDVAMIWICWGQLGLTAYLLASGAALWVQCGRDFRDW